jgi:peptidoglycan/xylan/chitin deacetylase (PgdA/CDA1 family)
VRTDAFDPSLHALRAICRRRSVVLGYHGVADERRRDDLHNLQVPPRMFARQLDLLAAAGFQFVTFVELARLARGGTPPPGYAAITFDDGMRNNHATALPLLRERGIRATVFVTIGFIDGRSPWIGPNGDGAMMSTSELRELADAGWELGGHTLTHADLATLDLDGCRREILDGCAELEAIVDRPVETFAYPFGRYGPEAVQAVRESGLLAAVTTGSGRWDPYEMTRAMVGPLDRMPLLLLKLTDRYEPLLRSAPMRALRQASKRVRGRVSGAPAG